MKFSIQEFAMITLAYKGEIKGDQVQFERGNLPDWMFRLFGDYMEPEIGGYVLTKFGEDIIVDKLEILDTYIRIPRTKFNLYHNRWLFPIILADKISLDEFQEFIISFENEVIKGTTEIQKLSLATDDASLYLTLNFISLWSTNSFEINNKTIFICNKSLLVDEIDIDKLFVSDIITCIEEEYMNLPIVKNIIIEVGSIQIDKMLDIWRSLVINDDLVRKTISEKYSKLDSLYDMILNAYHTNSVLREEYCEKYITDADNLLYDIIVSDHAFSFGLFKTVFEDGCVNATPIGPGPHGLFDEMQSIVRKSKFHYIDISGNIIGLCMYRDHNQLLRSGADQILDDHYQSIDTLTKKISTAILKIAGKTIAAKNASIPFKPLSVDGAGIRKDVITNTDIIRAFASYYIDTSNIFTDHNIFQYALDHFYHIKDQSYNPESTDFSLIHPDIIKRFLIDYQGSDSNVEGNSDKTDPVLWDFSIAGMIHYLLSDEIRPIKIATNSMIKKLLGMTVELPRDIFDTPLKSGLLRVAKGPDITIIQEDGELLLLVCALLNDEMLKNVQCRAYLMTHLELDSDGEKVRRAFNILSEFHKLIGTPEFENTLRDWLTTNRIPNPIRKYGSVKLKLMIAECSKDVTTNTKLYRTIDAYTNYEDSTTHLIEEFSLKAIPMIDVHYCNHKIIVKTSSINNSDTHTINIRQD